MSLLPPDNACYSCGCKPSEVQLSLKIARDNIGLVEQLEQLRIEFKAAQDLVREDYKVLSPGDDECECEKNRVCYFCRARKILSVKF